MRQLERRGGVEHGTTRQATVESVRASVVTDAGDRRGLRHAL
jgi:hypothetical protein